VYEEKHEKVYTQSDYVETDKKASMSEVLEQIGTDIASLMYNSNMTVKSFKDTDGRLNTFDSIIADLLKRIGGIENHLFRDK
tara:strand:- start:372 stop:617 length:246 start_codon:yes stop_codon:yes gene_type:complete